MAKEHVILNHEIVEYAKPLLLKGIKSKDAYHISCAIYANCDVFFTTDKKILQTLIPEIRVLNPIDYIREGG